MSHISKCGVKLTDPIILSRVFNNLNCIAATGSGCRRLVTTNTNYAPVLWVEVDGAASYDSEWHSTRQVRQDLLQQYTQQVLEQQAALNGFSYQTHKDANGDLVVEVQRY